MSVGAIVDTLDVGEPAIVTEGLHKRFGAIHALDDVSLTVPACQPTRVRLLVGRRTAGLRAVGSWS